MDISTGLRFIFNTRSFQPTVESMIHLNRFQPRLFYLSGAFFRFWWRHLPVPFEDHFYREWHKVWEGRCGRPLVDMHAFRFAAQVSYVELVKSILALAKVVKLEPGCFMPRIKALERANLT